MVYDKSNCIVASASVNDTQLTPEAHLIKDTENTNMILQESALVKV